MIASTFIYLLLGTGIHVPFVENPDIRIDGILDEATWTVARAMHIGSTHVLRTIHDQHFLYLSFHTSETVKRYMEVLLAGETGDTLILHASMQLGERAQGYNTPFRWGTFATWDANTTTAGDLKSDRPIHREFRINKQLLTSNPVECTIHLTSFFDAANTITKSITLRLTP